MKFCCFFKKDRQTFFRALEMEQTKLFKVPQILNEPLIFTWEMGKKKVRGSTRWSASEFSGHCIIGLVAIRTAAGDPAEAAGTLFHCPNFFLYFFLYFLCS